MKLKFVIALITAMLFNVITSGIIADMVGISPLVVFAGLTLLSLLPLAPKGSLCVGLNKEIWIPEIIEKFYPETSILSYAKNLDAFVDNNTINLQEAGADPNVYIDNMTYPIPINDRADVHHSIMLQRFDSENTVYRNAVEIEESAEKRQSVINGHRTALQQKFAGLAAYNWAPLKETGETPVEETTGLANKQGYKAMTFADILQMEIRFNMLEVPQEGRILALCPTHANDLMLEDIKMYKAIYNENRLFSFQVVRTSLTPAYDGATSQKKVYGAAAAATDALSSLAYYRDAVGRCQGTFDMFFRLADPEYRGDIVGFNMRGAAMPITGKYIGAFISKK